MANLINLETNEYPVSIDEFKRRFPNVSFPQQIPFADFGYAAVFPVPRPGHDAMTHTAREIAPVLTTKGAWEQQWEVVALK